MSKYVVFTNKSNVYYIIFNYLIFIINIFILKLFINYINLSKKVRLPGLEPGSQAWKAGVLPLYQKRFLYFYYSYFILLFILFFIIYSFFYNLKLIIIIILFYSIIKFILF